ncbi:hypothetical protein KP79_PYT23064 [Mizuhopecten yessoensis]|uniref:Uncharacterized protein n=1 Tax=Mizuhopecten yessoensis TaxID=6573 RepID=A0A210PQ66_MIZYE|nr:hypothetical protein KP79_PYT23064 [Mizuhopecten yessoensis]
MAAKFNNQQSQVARGINLERVLFCGDAPYFASSGTRCCAPNQLLWTVESLARCLGIAAGFINPKCSLPVLTLVGYDICGEGYLVFKARLLLIVLPCTYTSKDFRACASTLCFMEVQPVIEHFKTQAYSLREL